MKLWILLPQENLPGDDDPWDPWYDKCFGFVVRADDETSARAAANEQAGDENRGEFLSVKTANTKTPWLDEKYSSCRELTADGPAGVVLSDVRSA